MLHKENQQVYQKGTLGLTVGHGVITLPCWSLWPLRCQKHSGTEASRRGKNGWVDVCLGWLKIIFSNFFSTLEEQNRFTAQAESNFFDTWVTRLPAEMNVHIASHLWQVPQIPAFRLLASKIIFQIHHPYKGGESTGCLVFTQRNLYIKKSWHREACTHTEAFTQRSLSHRAAFSQRSFYTEELLHRQACTLRGSDTEKSFTQRSFCTQKLLHSKTLTQRSFYTQKLVRKETFTNRNFYTQRTFTQKLLHTEAFTPKKPLHGEAFTHRSFYIQKLLLKETLHRRTCTQRSLYAPTRLHTHRSFCTEKSLPIFHHVSFFMIIHHLASWYLRFHALLVSSLRRLVFISHDVLSIHASSSLPLRRSKLNENPGINRDYKDGIELKTLAE